MCKFAIDQDSYLSPMEKLIRKQAISSTVTDSIDREVELQCDFIDFQRDCAHLFVDSWSWYGFSPYNIHMMIEATAEFRRHQVNQAAEAYRQRYYHRCYYSCA